MRETPLGSAESRAIASGRADPTTAPRRPADDDPASFSPDGEMIPTHETLPGRVTMPVGEAYDPDPGTESKRP